MAKERFTKKFPKISQALALLASLIVIFSTLSILSNNPSAKSELGVSFSKKFSEYLGLDWRANYEALFTELGVRHVRIPTYWDEVEPNDGEYRFEDVDWQLELAKRYGADVVVVLGMRQPRWPECHIPSWASEEGKEVRDLKVQQLVLNTVQRYKNYKNIIAWQVENEPLLEFFGKCPSADRTLIKQEVNLVKSLDSRPVLVTASGELSLWYPEALWGDILGTTMYRTTWNKYIGYWSYWFVPASFYRIKSFIVGKNHSTFWVAELQAEPWFPGDPLTESLTEQYKSMDPEKLLENVEFAKKTQAGRIYLWGAEWWYYAKERLGAPQMWEAARSLKW